MGSCLGHCRLAKESFSLYKFYSKTNDSVVIQINDLTNSESEQHILDLSPALHDKSQIEFNPRIECEPKKLSFERYILKPQVYTTSSLIASVNHLIIKQDNSVLRLQLLDDEWSLTDGDHSARTESLVMPSSFKRKLDKSQNSASVNSLDLEWEHLPEMTVFSTNVDKEEPQSATSGGGWSRLSSADSLEWDSAEVEIKEEMDTETEQLLQEIEMLSAKTLQETLEWAS